MGTANLLSFFKGKESRIKAGVGKYFLEIRSKPWNFVTNLQIFLADCHLVIEKLLAFSFFATKKKSIVKFILMVVPIYPF